MGVWQETTQAATQYNLRLHITPLRLAREEFAILLQPHQPQLPENARRVISHSDQPTTGYKKWMVNVAAVITCR